MKHFRPFLLAVLLLVPVGCVKDVIGLYDTTYYGNVFAYNLMKTYYLWEAEVADGFSSWTYSEDPFQKVESMRYKNGDLEDKWTRLYDDCSGFIGTVTGSKLSLGFDFGLYYANASHSRVCAVVRYTYADSPASGAGLKRGDIILTLDGKEMTPDNYKTLVNEKIYGGGTVKLGLNNGNSVTLTAVQQYENPVQTALTLQAEGKKIGYLHFTSFTMDACRDLEETFRQFKDDGIEELVLDLRYNGGGYTVTSAVLASMLAPLSEVNAGSVFNRDVYNKDLNEYYKDRLETPFAAEYEIDASSGSGKYKVHPAQVNPCIKKLWVITTDDTASASEALICGLKPYMDVVLVGEKTYGKFCGGFLIQAEDFFDALSDEDGIDAEEGKEKLAGWGMYVIASRYADKDGVTLSMPNGIPADYEVKDNPREAIPLGDPSETMLAKVLALSTGTVTKAPLTAPVLPPAPPVRPAGFGALLKTLPK